MIASSTVNATIGLRFLALLCLGLSLAGCVSQTVKSTSIPALQAPASMVPEDELLDVAVAIFDPGIDFADEDERLYPEVRRAEARYIPKLLAEVLQNSGAWGAVRVVPNDDRITDLMIRGTILHSDGETLEIQVVAKDSRDYVWLDRVYEGSASRYAYDTKTRSSYDPFQAVYHQVANDLVRRFDELPTAQRKEIRMVSELLFAQSFSAEAFDGYLDKTRKGKQLVVRLPAEDDPMLERVRMLRERDHVFVDTLQTYYNGFSDDMFGPYHEWRKLSYQEVVAYQELKRESTRQLIAGGAAIIAGIAAAGSGDRSARAAGNVAIIGGGYLLKSGLESRAEAQIHVEALEEIGQSLEAEITPQVIELEDRTVMISGSVDDQYAQWREVLAEIYRNEIGELAPPASDDPVQN
ncbi:hypothetical protein [Congregibacter sp.]|uniref:hypothetical protein n=1 Tax=Congregibacter sp. TaxID=2744308 RepID=UPI003F6B2613